MSCYDLFFYVLISFILGVLLASFGWELSIIILISLLISAIFLFLHFFFEKSYFAFLAALTLFLVVGAIYFQLDQKQINDSKIIFGEQATYSGKIINDPKQGFLIVKLSSLEQERILLKNRAYSSFRYADEIEFSGKIQKSPETSYFIEKGIIGRLSSQEIKLIKRNKTILGRLFDFKHQSLSSFEKTLTPLKASFLKGLVFGERKGLSPDFRESMNLTGTSHLFAFSGLHLTIVSLSLANLIRYFLPPLLTIFPTFIIIFAFTAMTAFRVSAVRAAIMGFLIFIAQQKGRKRSYRNLLALTAFVLILFNPRSLYYDISFQLSFLAVLGIIYLREPLTRLLKLKKEPGFLSWRQNFLMTLSAQLATAPLLIISFNRFSLTSVLANVLILVFIPLTMALGYLLAFSYFISPYLGLVLAQITSLLLSYEIFIVNSFAQIQLLIDNLL